MNQDFDFTLHIRILCEDIISQLEVLRHVDMSRVAVGCSQTRSSARKGMYATLTALRFPGGNLHTIRRGRKWGMQKVIDRHGREMFYILNFYLPRFLNLSFREKLDTVLHELWHIGPEFDGDIRRIGKRCFAHGPSKKKYDQFVAALVDQYLAQSPPEAVYDFLRVDFRELSARHGRVWGAKFPVPKLFRVD